MAASQHDPRLLWGPNAPPAPTSVWAAPSQAASEVPATEWEYQMRRTQHDAAYASLAYAPACTHAPTHAPGTCPAPVYVWKRKQS